MSMRSVNPGPDIRIHFGAHLANPACNRANISGSVTVSLRLTSAAIIRKSIAPVVKTSVEPGQPLLQRDRKLQLPRRTAPADSPKLRRLRLVNPGFELGIRWFCGVVVLATRWR